MVVIIAEKPSLGRNIADAIGGMIKKNGYIEGKEYTAEKDMLWYYFIFDLNFNVDNFGMNDDSQIVTENRCMALIDKFDNYITYNESIIENGEYFFDTIPC